MIAAICLLLPAVVLCCVRGKVIDTAKQYSSKKLAAEYLIAVMALNYVLLAVLTVLFHNKEDLVGKLGQYNNFALKYLTLSVALAVAEPFVERYIKQNVSFSVAIPKQCFKIEHQRLAAVILALVLVGMNFIRIFDNNLWGDEGYTARITGFSVKDMIDATARDVHPPLYYLIVQAVGHVLGFSGSVYHLVSLIPYILIVVIALTYVWDRYGKTTSIILLLFSSILNTAVTYNVEIRMYSWGEFFVLVSFLALHRILETGAARHYIIFTLASLAAAYTHYYALISVAFFYALILALALFADHKMLKKALAASVVTVAAYMPWLFILLNAFGRVSKSFWVSSIPSFKDCVIYLFSSKRATWLAAVFVCTAAAALVYETKLLKVEKEEKKISARVDISELRISASAWWILGGLLSVFGTIAVGIGVSVVFRPIFLLRYLIPVSAVAWLLMGCCISKCKLKVVYAAFVVIVALYTCVPSYISTYKSEKDKNDRLTSTLAATTDIAGENDIILTNASHINWTIAGYYYPTAAHSMIALDNIPELDSTKNYWLIITEELSEDESAAFEARGYSPERIVERGNLGTHDIWIYKLVK